MTSHHPFFFHKIVIVLLVTLSLLTVSSPNDAANEAEQLFKQYQKSLYQIRLIDIATGNKAAIGSGFQISDDGLIATNYHVISNFVLYPGRYRIEYLGSQGEKGQLHALDVDVLNDLALLKGADLPDVAIDMAAQPPTKGETIFSLGNPRDLGMVVVPGTYNGLKEKSYFERIHFTGAINPGMSGGPVLNRHGKVVGVNVATAGNNIGFLVPHDKLVNLIESQQVNNAEALKTRIFKQLQSNQQSLMDKILSHEWESQELGDARIPTQFAQFLPCWGGSNTTDEKARHVSATSNCRLAEDIFISHNFRTGIVEMQFEWMKSNSLLSHQFYRLYKSHFGSAGPGNWQLTKKYATDYSCQHDIVQGNLHKNTTMKAVFCTRAYKDFPGLFDVFYISANVDKTHQGLVSHFTLAGVQKQNALDFLKRFMEAISWK